MGEEKINTSAGRLRVLIAPLDWGLGHATRCVPIIRQLIANNCEVFVAAKNGTKVLLKKEFTELVFLPLAGYNIHYSHKRSLLPLKLLAQLPALIYSIYKEHQWLKKTVKTYKVDIIISDNRLGLYHSTITSVYITHQLLIKTGNRFSEKIFNAIHHWFIKKYNVCWVPDFEGAVNIAGELSHPKKRSLHLKYLGCFSRFKKIPFTEKRYKLIVIISGPEPQRTIFENILLQQLHLYKHPVLFVRGLPGKTTVKESSNQFIHIVDHLSGEELNNAIQQADLVISRSGYTTIMDLVKLQQQAIFVPTPGQTEQEYLAQHLCKQKIFLYAGQENFSLQGSLDQASQFSFIIPEFNMEQYKIIIDEFIDAQKK